MIIIGSTALKHWFPDFKREPKDKDILVHHKSKYEGKLAGTPELLENPVLWNYLYREGKFPELCKCPYLQPDLLCTLKASHLCWNINWDKHMFDVQFLLKKDFKINTELFWMLYEHWNIVHSKNKRSDLKMSKEDFFDNAINYNDSEHDDLHKILNPVPIYTRVLKDNCEVELDEQKFNSLSFEEKLNFVREEVMVMAYERYKSLGYKRAYHRMIRKFIISHAPLFSLLFIIENYVELHVPKVDYFKILNNGIANKCKSSERAF